MREAWVDIQGFEGYYQVSNLGQIRSLDRTVVTSNGRMVSYKGQIVAPQKHLGGYRKVTLAIAGHDKQVTVHRLVATHFVANPENKSEVNHINGIKSDNRADNLEWCTPSENQSHSYHALGRRVSTKRGIEHVSSKRVSCDTLGITFGSAAEAARALDVSLGNLCAICNGKSKLPHTKGLTFRYI
jgi:hypothetical protein